jgi:ubiquinone biosynthesis protein
MISRVAGIGKTYRHARRFKEIVSVLAGHGFGDLVRALRRPRGGEPAHINLGPTRIVRLRMICEELGPAFVKLGQMLSTRRDLVPSDVVAELEKLQNTVTPFPGGEAVRIIGEDLGGGVGELFKSFDPVPLASASIAQVHRAVTKSGNDVVVKVRRPGINEVVETDLQIMETLAGLLEQYVADARVFDPVSTVREFSRLMRSELDFAMEASRIERTAALFGDSQRFRVPKVHRALCSPRVLTMEFIDGVKVSDIGGIRSRGLDPGEIVRHCAEALFRQIFFHGFFHSDPHPGNVLALDGNAVCFLDYGQMGSLSPRQREDFGQLIFGLVSRDEHRIAEAVFRLSGYSAFENHAHVEQEIRKFNEDRLYRPLGEIRIGPLLADLSRILVDNDIHMPAEFFVVCKCLSTFDGVVRSVVPGFDAVEFSMPFARELIGRRAGMRQVVGEIERTAAEIQSLVRRTPQEIREAISLLKRGEIEVRVSQPVLARAVNRLAFAGLVAAMVVASTILLAWGPGPKWWGLPAIGVASAALAALGALFFLASAQNGNNT